MYRLRARLHARPERGSQCDERVEIAPAGSVRTAAAIALPGEVDRIEAAIESSDLAAERRCAGAVEMHNHATVAYRYRHALIADGCWYAGGEYEVMRPQHRRPLIVGAGRHVQEAQLCTDLTSERFFGHWFCDGLSMELLAADRAVAPVALSGTTRVHEEGYRRLVGLRCEKVDVARVDRLWVVDDRGYNRYRVERLRRLRSRLRASVQGRGHRLVFVDRGNTGAARHLVNRDALLERLVREGFVVIQPETQQAGEIAAVLADARLVVGVEGSQLKHAMLALDDGAGILAIQPPDRFNMWNKQVAQSLGLNFGFVAGDACDGGFGADIDRTLRTIDLMLGAPPVHLDC